MTKTLLCRAESRAINHTSDQLHSSLGLASRSRVGSVRRNVRPLNGVLVRATILAKVGGILLRPAVVVESTVLANRLAVLHQHVSVVELAGLDVAAIGWRVGSSVVGLSSASSGTLGNVKGS